MSRLLVFILIGIIIGMVLGYFIFAQIGDSYIPVRAFFSLNENPQTIEGALKSLGKSLEQTLLDVKTKRRNIIILGLAGGLAGAFFSVFSKRRKR